MRLFEFSEYARTLLGINIISNLFIMDTNSKNLYKFNKEISAARLEQVRNAFAALRTGDLVTLTYTEGNQQHGRISHAWISNDYDGSKTLRREFTYCDENGETKTVEINPINGTIIHAVNWGRLDDHNNVLEIKVTGREDDESKNTSLCTISGGRKKKRVHSTRKKRRRSAINRGKSRRSRR